MSEHELRPLLQSILERLDATLSRLDGLDARLDGLDAKVDAARAEARAAREAADKACDAADAACQAAAKACDEAILAREEAHMASDATQRIARLVTQHSHEMRTLSDAVSSLADIQAGMSRALTELTVQVTQNNERFSRIIEAHVRARTTDLERLAGFEERLDAIERR